MTSDELVAKHSHFPTFIRWCAFHRVGAGCGVLHLLLDKFVIFYFYFWRERAYDPNWHPQK